MREFINKPEFTGKFPFICKGEKRTCFILVMTFVLIALIGCERQKSTNKQTSYTVPVSQLEKNFGQLITVANIPTNDQNGTGDRLGLFRDESSTFWGIPLTRDSNGNVAGCAPATLNEVPVSDTLPADTVEIVGAANEPTNWRGGTGNLELLLRNEQGNLIWHSVREVETKLEPVCWSQSDPVQPLPFYRLVIAEADN